MKFIWDVTLEWKLKGKSEDWNIGPSLKVVAETSQAAIDAAMVYSADKKFAELRLVSVKRGDFVDIFVS